MKKGVGRIPDIAPCVIDVMIPCAIGSLPTCDDLSGRTETIVFGKTKLMYAFIFFHKVKETKKKH